MIRSIFHLQYRYCDDIRSKSESQTDPSCGGSVLFDNQPIRFRKVLYLLYLVMLCMSTRCDHQLGMFHLVTIPVLINNQSSLFYLVVFRLQLVSPTFVISLPLPLFRLSFIHHRLQFSALISLTNRVFPQNSIYGQVFLVTSFFCQ